MDNVHYTLYKYKANEEKIEIILEKVDHVLKTRNGFNVQVRVQYLRFQEAAL